MKYTNEGKTGPEAVGPHQRSYAWIRSSRLRPAAWGIDKPRVNDEEGHGEGQVEKTAVREVGGSGALLMDLHEPRGP